MAAASSGTGQEARDRRYWFHILARPAPEARLQHAVKLTEKAWRQGDRVGIACDSKEQAQALDDLLWSFSPEAFIPHAIVPETTTCAEPVGLLLGPPAAADWDTVIVLSSALPAEADRFRRLALIAHNDPAILNQARSHYRQLRSLGITPQVHDQRKR
ncbi:DNA polymerase III subunit chi [Marinobacter lutaoensis]|jgi:DNA polymerase-3 subunit chi|uniref:DNA polymerase III subunit chi n=1 Tax=Marinobacter lutaoensis TaxID=135739 RepID=A0A1V2DPR7_9GAMM|nr:DNA polymerase III subunit chi [Marinobacter lutaoensis]MBI42022.1 DNA polymerase III subunit chi [Oceanospirillales bacterium]ONF42396.1 DNA polymerase III subunit chi [Marinobacter lutaoensis]|tara:strand:+ start:39 stop:512 length:474 start_codon:yes stop_codon:yes gene_type:complete